MLFLTSSKFLERRGFKMLASCGPRQNAIAPRQGTDCLVILFLACFYNFNAEVFVDLQISLFDESR
jgi:hypothetical protein